MRMLDGLKPRLPDLKIKDPWAHEFVSDMLKRFDDNPQYKLSKAQFQKLNEIHQRYAKRWVTGDRSHEDEKQPGES